MRTLPNGRLSLRRSPKLRAVLRYATAPVAAFGACAIEHALLPDPGIAPFAFFFFAVTLASWLSGRLQGALTALLSAALANYFFIGSFHAWALSGPALTATGLYLVSTLAAAMFIGSLRVSINRSKQAQTRLKSLFDNSPVPLWEEDASEIRTRFDELRSSGVTDLGAYLKEHPDELIQFASMVRIRDVSRTSASLFGGSDIDIKNLPKLLTTYMTEEGLQVFGRELAAVWHGQTSFEDELPIRVPDGQVRFFAIRLSVVPGSEQTLSRILVSFLDLTDRRAAEQALKDSNRRKDEFLAVLSHELRNPLAPIKNSLYILNRTFTGGEQARRAVEVIGRQVGNLTKLVDDLLQVTRIARGQVNLERIPLNLAEAVRRAAEDHALEFQNKGLTLETVLPDHEIWIEGDAVRLAEIFSNLLQNSVKFTPHGGKTTISLSADTAAGRAIVQVRDTGIGIPPDLLPRLFEPFRQADRSLDRSRGGLGLGLTLVKGLVELHGGTVKASSEGVGKGAEFTLTFPSIRDASRAGDQARHLAGGSGLRVLVIEDNVDAAQSLREALELNNHEVEVAYSGAEGLEKARRFNPEVVLCDIGLPIMDGYQVARAMRGDPRLCGGVLVALTGYTGQEDVERARAAGFDSHVGKPPDMGELEALLRGAKTIRVERASTHPAMT
jgi:signal transduction histidine kinase/CheY-like chemotaxis protein